MKKIQQFYIFKIDSSRLKEAKYKISNLSINQARINSEIVAVANSQLIRTIHKLTDKSFSQERLNNLLFERNLLSKKKNDRSNRKKTTLLNGLIDEELFISQLVSLHVENKKHYEYILNNGGFFVNNVRFVPLMASSGQIRRNTVFFIDETLKDEITRIFNNGRNEEKELVPAKFSAYYSLYSSSSLPVSTPKFAVVPDLVMNLVKRVNFAEWVGDGIDPIIQETDKELEFNGFDGQCLISPAMSDAWGEELGLDYIPSWFIVRAPFLKGQLITFDFHDFAEKIAHKEIIIDIYGREINIYDIDVLVSASQFKLWESYLSTEQYLENCEKNDLGWGITKAAPKVDKNFCRSSYQFLQVLDLKEDDVKEICKPTLDWLNAVSGGDLLSTLLYLLGDINMSESGWFNRLEPLVQALLFENEILKDSYLIDHLSKSLSKKKNDAKIGRLVFRGSYQNIMADPYAQAVWIFGGGIEPLLNDKEHYSQYWNERAIKQVAAVRSPIVHSSEINTLNLQDREDVNYWYQYITSGIIFPTNGIGLDFAITGGSDGDGDQVATIDHPSFINCRIESLPIFYNTTKAKKIPITTANEEEVFRSHLTGMNQKVGYYTNVSTTFYTLLDNFEKGTKEYNAILQRLQWGRVMQGLEIDRIKGLAVPPFPKHFVERKKIDDDMSPEEKETQEFYNNILADKRPLFQMWLYNTYRKKYKYDLERCDTISRTDWETPFEEILQSSNRTEAQQKLVDWYLRKTGFIDNNSPMNLLSKYIASQLEKIKLEKRNLSKEFDYRVLLSEDYRKPAKYLVEKMVLLFKEYKSLRRNLREGHGEFENQSSMDQVSEYICKKAFAAISSNAAELADIAVYVCYGGTLGKNSKAFCWNVFGKYIVANIRGRIKRKYVRIPRPSNTGRTEYLFEKYSFYNINIEE